MTDQQKSPRHDPAEWRRISDRIGGPDDAQLRLECLRLAVACTRSTDVAQVLFAARNFMRMAIDGTTPGLFVRRSETDQLLELVQC